MTHRVHPKAFRIKEITNWHSRGFYKKKFPEYLEEDFKIREFLKKKLGRHPPTTLRGREGAMGVEKIEIERSPGKIIIIISSARPGLIIGRGGEGVEELRKELDNILKLPQGEKREIKLEIKEIKDPWASASLAAQWIAQQIEKRIPHRRVLKQALGKIMATKGVEGARVEVAGRLGGVEIARTEWLKRGRLPRQTLRAEIDYAQDRAYCTYGVVGVKVWIYKGERFE